MRDGIWCQGLSFASWKEETIPAHIGRLLAYALTDAQANTDQARALIDHALRRRPLPAQYRSSANAAWAEQGLGVSGHHLCRRTSQDLPGDRRRVMRCGTIVT